MSKNNYYILICIYKNESFLSQSCIVYIGRKSMFTDVYGWSTLYKMENLGCIERGISIRYVNLNQPWISREQCVSSCYLKGNSPVKSPFYQMHTSFYSEKLHIYIQLIFHLLGASYMQGNISWLFDVNMDLVQFY